MYSIVPAYIPVCQWSDDESWGVPKVLVAVSELGVADICKAVELLSVPPEVER